MSSQPQPRSLRSSELFGEMGAVSILVLLSCLPLVSWVAAVAAGVAHMRRDLAALGSGTGDFASLFTRALRGGWAPGAASLGLFGLLVANLHLIRVGAVPGGAAAAAVSGTLLVLAWTVCLRAACLWSTSEGKAGGCSAREWFTLARRAATINLDDPSGTALLVASALMGVVLVWMFLPMFILVPGLWVLAGVGVEFRRDRMVAVN